MQYHPSRDWLSENGHDTRLEKHVHIPHAKELYQSFMWNKHPYVVLHELAHAYHDQLLSFDNPEIVSAYEKAKESGTYEKVLLHTGDEVRHYGMNNQMEYFAEATEAYFGVNDFYPFVRAELERHDPAGFAIMEKFWSDETNSTEQE
jgi:dipeptidyl-peptidase-4